jgi:hypothetical protein
MPDERLEVSVTFDERGYIGSAPELRQAVVALSLGGLRRKIEIAMLPDDVRVVLQLDGLAERERHRRRAQAQLSRIAQLGQRTALPDQCLHSAETDVRPPRRKSGFGPNAELHELYQTAGAIIRERYCPITLFFHSSHGRIMPPDGFFGSMFTASIRSPSSFSR